MEDREPRPTRTDLLLAISREKMVSVTQFTRLYSYLVPDDYVIVQLRSGRNRDTFSLLGGYFVSVTRQGFLISKRPAHISESIEWDEVISSSADCICITRETELRITAKIASGNDCIPCPVPRSATPQGRDLAERQSSRADDSTAPYPPLKAESPRIAAHESSPASHHQGAISPRDTPPRPPSPRVPHEQSSSGRVTAVPSLPPFRKCDGPREASPRNQRVTNSPR